MLILTIRTDKPEAEIGLFKDTASLAYHKWQADRLLAESIHKEIKQLLEQNRLGLNQIEAVAVYQGPGSFTGLRIGISVANALADSLSVPIVGYEGEKWLEQGTQALVSGKNQKVVLPEYGSPPHITAQKK